MVLRVWLILEQREGGKREARPGDSRSNSHPIFFLNGCVCVCVCVCVCERERERERERQRERETERERKRERDTEGV